MITPIEKAIQKSDLGLNPSNDGKIIRLVFPELNEERRKELTKLASKSAEEAKVAVRSIRRDAIEQLKKMKKLRQFGLAQLCSLVLIVASEMLFLSRAKQVISMHTQV